jgi:hypothetical protein
MCRMGSSRRAPRRIGDVALVFGKDEQGVHILRRRSEDGPLEAGVVEPLTEGRPITGEVVSLRRRKDLPFLFDVKTEVEGPARETSSESEGPARVATDSYRKGWDKIWGRRGSGKLN